MPIIYVDILALSGMKIDYARIGHQEGKGSMRVILELGQTILEVIQHEFSW